MANDDSRAVASLVCGILSWFTCPLVLAIVAIVLGSGSSSGFAKAGVILGWLNILVCVGGFVVFLLVAIGSAAFGFN